MELKAKDGGDPRKYDGITDIIKASHEQEFVREPRYYVLKLKDINRYLDKAEYDFLMSIGNLIANGRAADGKPPFNAAVVEQDWPEFEPVWAMIEARMKGAQ